MYIHAMWREASVIGRVEYAVGGLEALRSATVTLILFQGLLLNFVLTVLHKVRR